MITFLIAFLSASLILYSSKKSYQKYVKKSIENRIDMGDGKDSIDKIDDPFDLYSDEVEKLQQDEKETFKTEKKRFSILKQKKEIAKTLPTNFSFFRLFSYGVLIVGFIYLKESGNLDITLYLTGITVGIIFNILIYRFGNSPNR